MYVSYHAPGETVKNLRTGDFILSRSETDQGKAIRTGQALKYGMGHPAVEVNHAALSLGGFKLVESLASGVHKTSLLNYEDDYYAAIHTGVYPHDQAQMERFVECVIKEKTGYGYLHIVSILVSLMIPTKIFFGISCTETCSGFVAETMTRAGWIWRGPPAFTYPADMAVQCGVDLPWFEGV